GLWPEPVGEPRLAGCARSGVRAVVVPAQPVAQPVAVPAQPVAAPVLGERAEARAVVVGDLAQEQHTAGAGQQEEDHADDDGGDHRSLHGHAAMVAAVAQPSGVYEQPGQVTTVRTEYVGSACSSAASTATRWSTAAWTSSSSRYNGVKPKRATS